MARITIVLPEKFLFTTTIPVRITDVNYGGHVGNDKILTLIHEGRMQFLKHYGYSEKDMGGVGLIMGDVAIQFRNELFYGDNLRMSISVSDISKVSFDIVYLLEKESGDQKVVVAQAKTGMVCFNYENKRIVSLPQEVKDRWI